KTSPFSKGTRNTRSYPGPPTWTSARYPLDTVEMDLPLPMPDDLPRHGDLQLRALDEEDVPMLLDLSTDPYLPLIGTLPANTDRVGAHDYIERQNDRLDTGGGYSFCAALTETDEAIGLASLGLTAIQ